MSGAGSKPSNSARPALASRRVVPPCHRRGARAGGARASGRHHVRRHTGGDFAARILHEVTPRARARLVPHSDAAPDRRHAMYRATRHVAQGGSPQTLPDIVHGHGAKGLPMRGSLSVAADRCGCIRRMAAACCTGLERQSAAFYMTLEKILKRAHRSVPVRKRVHRAAVPREGRRPQAHVRGSCRMALRKANSPKCRCGRTQPTSSISASCAA